MNNIIGTIIFWGYKTCVGWNTLSTYYFNVQSKSKITADARVHTNCILVYNSGLTKTNNHLAF